MIRFIGNFRDLKELGFQFKLLGSLRSMTWTLYNPENIWHEYIRIWRSGNFIELCNLNNMSDVFIETILDEKLFESTKYEYKGNVVHAFMIDRKEPKYEKFIFTRHDRNYLLDNLLESTPIVANELVNILNEETENKNIIKLTSNDWIIQQVRNLSKLGMIISENKKSNQL